MHHSAGVQYTLYTSLRRPSFAWKAIHSEGTTLFNRDKQTNHAKMMIILFYLWYLTLLGPAFFGSLNDVCLFVCYCKKRHNNICEFIICCEYFRPQARFKHWQNIKEKSTRFKIRDKTFTFIMISPLVQLGWRPVHGRNRQSTAHKWIKEDDLMKITFTFLQIISSDWFVWKRNKRNANCWGRHDINNWFSFQIRCNHPTTCESHYNVTWQPLPK